MLSHSVQHMGIQGALAPHLGTPGLPYRLERGRRKTSRSAIHIPPTAKQTTSRKKHNKSANVSSPAKNHTFPKRNKASALFPRLYEERSFPFSTNPPIIPQQIESHSSPWTRRTAKSNSNPPQTSSTSHRKSGPPPAKSSTCTSLPYPLPLPNPTTSAAASKNSSTRS